MVGTLISIIPLPAALTGSAVATATACGARFTSCCWVGCGAGAAGAAVDDGAPLSCGF